ncbi:MAG: thioredoxin family protein [Thermoanaerobaculia bacterium]|jgi:small redox-active disulfide protein 2
MHHIEVLGPGCTRCKETFRVVQQVVESAGIQVELVKEESYERMAALGVMSTPAVVIDGTVVVSGRIPKAAEMRELLGIS